MAERPQPYALWRQATDEIDAACRAGGDPHADPTPRYLELLREHGHVVPADHPDAGGPNLPCGWPGERAAEQGESSTRGKRIADLLETAAAGDEGREGEVVVLRRDELFQFLGLVALPPWPGGGGEDLDCAPIAQSLVEWVEAHRL